MRNGLAAWDMAAGALMEAEAGGRVTDYQSGEGFIPNKQSVAANPRLHTEVLVVLRGTSGSVAHDRC